MNKSSCLSVHERSSDSYIVRDYCFRFVFFSGSLKNFLGSNLILRGLTFDFFVSLVHFLC